MSDHTIYEYDITEEIVSNFIEVKLLTDFAVIVETLSRIGIPDLKTKRLFQTCHIFHKRQRYFIVHFKEMLILDLLKTSMSSEDIRRRNTIAYLLQKWGLVEVISNNDCLEDREKHMYIVKYADKKDWTFKPKYVFGSKNF